MIQNKCIAIRHILHFGEMHAFCMVLFSIFVSNGIYVKCTSKLVSVYDCIYFNLK